RRYGSARRSLDGVRSCREAARRQGRETEREKQSWAHAAGHVDRARPGGHRRPKSSASGRLPPKYSGPPTPLGRRGVKAPRPISFCRETRKFGTVGAVYDRAFLLELAN